MKTSSCLADFSPGRPTAVTSKPSCEADTLLVAGDGILEAADKSGNEFGLDRLRQILIENRVRPPATIANRIHTALKAGYAQQDDQGLRLCACRPRFFV